jgi:ferredoxin
MRWRIWKRLSCPPPLVRVRSDSLHLGKAPEFVRNVLGQIAAGKGDLLPVSAIPAGGAFPTGTAQWEKRNIAQFIPVWDKDLCIQCGKCVMVCPHAVIRAKVYSPSLGTRRRRPSSGPSPSGRAWSRSATRCRWLPRIAPAARSAWKSAR